MFVSCQCFIDWGVISNQLSLFNVVVHNVLNLGGKIKNKDECMEVGLELFFVNVVIEKIDVLFFL